MPCAKNACPSQFLSCERHKNYRGQIDSFDQFVVLLRNSVSQMVYKHAISTVVPARNVRLPTGEDGEVTEPAIVE